MKIDLDDFRWQAPLPNLRIIDAPGARCPERSNAPAELARSWYRRHAARRGMWDELTPAQREHMPGSPQLNPPEVLEGNVRRCLTTGPSNDRSPDWIYPFVQHKALFKVFAELPDNERDILAFAQEWGFLGDNLAHCIAPREDLTEYGETVEDWNFETSLMRLGEHLRIALQTKDEEAIASRITRDAAGVWLCDTNPQYRLDHHDEADPFALARIALYQIIRDHLSASIGLRHAHSTPESRVVPILAPTTEADSFVWRVEPRSLIGGLWAQFAMALADNTKFKKCEYCSRWFPDSPRGSERRFCSVACRNRGYRARQAGPV